MLGSELTGLCLCLRRPASSYHIFHAAATILWIWILLERVGHTPHFSALKVFKINWWWFYDRFECSIHSESIVLVLFVEEGSWMPNSVWCSVSVCSIVRCVGVGAMSLVSKCPHHRVRKYFKLISIKHVCPPVSWHVPHAGATCAPPPAPINQISPPRVPATSPAQPSPAGFLCPENINHQQQEQEDKNFHVDFYHLFIGSQNSFYSIFLPETKVVRLKLIKSDFKQNKSWTRHLPHKSGNDWPRKAVIGRVFQFWLWCISQMADPQNCKLKIFVNKYPKWIGCA